MKKRGGKLYALSACKILQALKGYLLRAEKAEPSIIPGRI